MGQFDLRDYAQASEKFTPESLVHDGSPSSKVPTLNLLCAYAFDGCVVFFGSLAAVFMLEMSASNHMVTRSLTSAYNQMHTWPIAFAVFAMLTYGYFFFSYFFNEGQTWGKSLFECRIHMTSMSYRHSFRWAVFSSLVLSTCGLFLMFRDIYRTKKGAQVYTTHDHLYQSLMVDRVLHPVDLVAIAEENSKTGFTEEFREAA